MTTVDWTVKSAKFLTSSYRYVRYLERTQDRKEDSAYDTKVFEWIAQIASCT